MTIYTKLPKVARRSAFSVSICVALTAVLLSGVADAGAPTGQQGTEATEVQASRTSRLQQLEALVRQLQQQSSAQAKRVSHLQREVDELSKTSSAARGVARGPTVPMPPVAPTSQLAARRPAGPSITLGGFTSATGFVQKGAFGPGNGASAVWAVPHEGPQHTLSGVDVRATRIFISAKGRTFSDGVLSGWTPSGYVEMDFLGGNNGTTSLAGVQPLPRMRQAWFRLANVASGTTITLGQQWDLFAAGTPLGAILPPSVTAPGFNPGALEGLIGYRFPGAEYSQRLTDGGSNGWTSYLDLGAYSGDWSGFGTTNFETAGNVGFHPQWQARVEARKGNFMALVAADYSHEDARGVDLNMPAPGRATFDTWGLETGAKWTPGAWEFLGLVYHGNALAPQAGALFQFGNIRESGGLAMAGYHFTPRLAMYATVYGTFPNAADVMRWTEIGTAFGELRSESGKLEVDYTMGNAAFGISWLRARMISSTPAEYPARHKTVANQLAVGAVYHF